MIENNPGNVSIGFEMLLEDAGKERLKQGA